MKMGPCAKQKVVAVVTHKSFKHNPESVIIGENICLTPQPICPRSPGEAYAKCLTHCSQLGHAEEVALRQIHRLGIAHSDITSIRVYGHHGPCDNCRALLTACGLLDVTTFHPDIEPPDLGASNFEQIADAFNLTNPSSHSRFVCIG